MQLPHEHLSIKINSLVHYYHFLKITENVVMLHKHETRIEFSFCHFSLLYYEIRNNPDLGFIFNQ